MENDIKGIIAKRHSLAAFLPGKDDIVGVIILDEKVKTRQSPPDLAKQGFPETFIKLDKFFQDLTTNYGSMDVFEKLETNRVLDIFMLCTSKAAAGRGIASALMGEALNVASKAGIRGLECMALSLYTQRICQRLNFQDVNRYCNRIANSTNPKKNVVFQDKLPRLLPGRERDLQRS